MTYIEDQKKLAAAWKGNTVTLPGRARVAAPYINKDGLPSDRLYPFCLPPEYAALSLLPEVRDPALALFAELGIPWHAGVEGGPSNHLLSSQVQCVNALMQMVEDPSRLVAAFGHVIEVGEVLEIEPGRFLTFEYIGPSDFFGEAPTGERIRGAHCTSVDAAFLHRAPDGLTELVLVEWKYTESYRRRKPDPQRDKVRFTRYGEAVADLDGPIRHDLLPFELLLDEPLYQLVRQQLLAHALEKAGVADRVRVVHVLSPDNEAYQQSIHRDEQKACGATVSEVWTRLLRHSDRFTSMDPAVFLEPAISSAEYALRYAVPMICNAADLMAALGVSRLGDVEDALYAQYEWDDDVEVTAEGLEVRQGQVGTVLPFPFRIAQIQELVNDLESDNFLIGEDF